MKYLLSILMLFTISLEADVYLKVNNDEMRSILNNRAKDRMVDHIVVDTTTINKVPFQIYYNKENKELARFISEKNIKNFYDIGVRDGLMKCLENKKKYDDSQYDDNENAEYKDFK